MKRLLLVAVPATIVMLLMLAPAAPAQTGGGCELNGTASFSPGLNTTAKDFAYSFGGDLSGCLSSEAGAPTAGTVSAGEVVTINGQQFQEPVPSGNGSCLSSTTAGTAIVTWSDGDGDGRGLLHDRCRRSGAAGGDRGPERDAASGEPAARRADLDHRDDDALRRCVLARRARVLAA